MMDFLPIIQLGQSIKDSGDVSLAVDAFSLNLIFLIFLYFAMGVPLNAHITSSKKWTEDPKDKANQYGMRKIVGWFSNATWGTFLLSISILFQASELIGMKTGNSITSNHLGAIALAMWATLAAASYVLSAFERKPWFGSMVSLGAIAFLPRVIFGLVISIQIAGAESLLN